MSRAMLRFLMLPALVGFALSGVAQAALIVDWGGQYVDSTQAGPTSGSDTGGIKFNSADNTIHRSRGGHMFSLDTARSPAANYTGTSDTFYGGLLVAVAGGGSGGSARMQMRVVQNGADDLLRMQRTVNEGNSSQKMAAMAIWRKEDFLNGFDAQTIDGGDLNSISVTSAGIGAKNDTQRAKIHRLRWWVATGDLAGSPVFYVSEDVTGPDPVGPIPPDTSKTWTTTNFSAIGWTTSPVTEGSYDRLYVTDTTFATATAGLTDITAIGFYVQASPDYWRAADLDYIEFSSVEIDVLPEPATLGLMVLGGLALLRRQP